MSEEWTAQTVFYILGTDYGDDGWTREHAIADAHNAALAAERSKLAIEHEARLAVVDELAAEQEKVSLMLSARGRDYEGEIQTLLERIKELEAK